MKLALAIIISFSIGYSTCAYFYSKYTDPDNISSFAKEAFVLGCLVKGKQSGETMSEVRTFCEEKSLKHKKALDRFFDVVL